VCKLPRKQYVLKVDSNVLKLISVPHTGSTLLLPLALHYAELEIKLFLDIIKKQSKLKDILEMRK
jgi:hypothetical protein